MRQNFHSVLHDKDLSLLKADYRRKSAEIVQSVTDSIVCLFGIFHSYGDVTISVEGLRILTYAPHLGPLSSGGSLTCHTYCDTGHSYNNGHLRGPVTLTPNAERFAVELSLPVLTT